MYGARSWQAQGARVETVGSISSNGWAATLAPSCTFQTAVPVAWLTP